ncbi:MAG TPA: type VI secretion system accessory protein TagJ [Candidatus Competibacteraceae bacterium]|nr:type VI secretion system accessory protein TagJ [Candidatus Competibacteraceae bacterium]
MSLSASQLYAAGRLHEAIALLGEELRQHPGDSERRGLLAELLCFAGEWERADKQLEVISHQEPQLAVGLAQFRQVLRAAQARAQFYSEGRLPEFLEPPDALLQLYLRASIALREGHVDEAEALLTQAESQRRPLCGACNGRLFDELRDLDDLTACMLEVLSSNGKYYWIPYARVERIEFHPPRRPRDLLWRPAHITVHDGPDGEVFLPAIYAPPADADEATLLGRVSDWYGAPDGPVRGRGQRTLLVGEEAVPLLEIETLVIAGDAHG